MPLPTLRVTVSLGAASLEGEIQLEGERPVNLAIGNLRSVVEWQAWVLAALGGCTRT